MGVLSEIAEDGHVYRLSAEIGSLKKNGGRPSFEKIGINKTSTFYGFCEKHDNKLFQPIDNDPLIPTDQQVLLYGYRSLCREIFVKENVLATIESQLEKGVGQKAVEEFFLDYQKGISFGLKNLKKHKTQYDDSIVNGDYQDINYVLFISTQKPVIAFSGGLYPDFDFMGRHLQDLGDHEKELEQISFSSAPMKSGWGFLFSWHKSSSIVCVDYMRSLATMMSNGKKLEDFLFRLVISGCENHAISPGWWDQLPDNHKEKVLERVNMDSNIHSMTQPSYLMSGLEGISDWKFGKVISKME